MPVKQARRRYLFQQKPEANESFWQDRFSWAQSLFFVKSLSMPLWC